MASQARKGCLQRLPRAGSLSLRFEIWHVRGSRCQAASCLGLGLGLGLG